MKNIGIVLKKYFPIKETASILDKDIGKIRCFTEKKCIPNGSIISYFVAKKRNRYTVKNIEILYIPFEAALNDILFFHHILEICYYFIPQNNQNAEVFELIRYLYYFGYKIKCILDKKLFLFKLFILLGLYPEGEKFQTPTFHKLAIESIDTLIGKKLDLKIETDIDMWLYSCIQMHPMFRKLKTVDFLYKNRCP